MKADNQSSKKRASGVPTGNAGEYFVMGELLRRGWDAQLADRNTKGYDILVGYPEEPMLRKVQVKTVRQPPWYVNLSNFEEEFLERSTIYVLLGVTARFVQNRTPSQIPAVELRFTNEGIRNGEQQTANQRSFLFKTLLQNRVQRQAVLRNVAFRMGGGLVFPFCFGLGVLAYDFEQIVR
jgi:hypothetical protein